MDKMNRRTALGVMAASGALLAGSRLAQGAHHEGAHHDGASLNLAGGDELARVYRKLAYSLDESEIWWWMRGTRYGLVDSIPTPFWDMYIGTWLKTRDVEGGGYEVTSAGANFYTPPGSTELLTSFSNPYTGEEVPLNYSAPKARSVTMTAESSSVFGEVNMPGMAVTPSSAIGPGWIEGEDVVIRGDMALVAEPVDPNSQARRLAVTDWSTYVGKLSDVLNPAVRNAPCVQYFNDFLTWPSWLKMGDQPGSYLSRCYGRKVFSYDQMPATWRALFAQAFPDAAKDPASLLGG